MSDELHVTPVLLRHRPTTVEAMQVKPNNLAYVATWCGGVVLPDRGVGVYTDGGDFAHAGIDSWMIKGPSGFYPCPDAVLFASYESVL